MKGQKMKQITKAKKIHEGDTLMVIEDDVTIIGTVTHVQREDYARVFYLGEDQGYAFYISDVEVGDVLVYRMAKGNR